MTYIKYCDKCGARVGKDDIYCWKCRNPLNMEQNNIKYQTLWGGKVWGIADFPLNLKIFGLISFIFALISSIVDIFLVSGWINTWGITSIYVDYLIFLIICTILSFISIASIFKASEWLGKILIFSTGYIITFFMFTSFHNFGNFITISSIINTIIFIIWFILILRKRELFLKVYFYRTKQIDSGYFKNINLFYIFGSITYLIFIIYNIQTVTRGFKILAQNIGAAGSNVSMKLTLISTLFSLFIIYLIIRDYIYIYKEKYCSVLFHVLLLAGLILARFSGGIILLLPIFFKYFFSAWNFAITVLLLILFLPWLLGIFGNRYLRRLYFRNF